MSFLCHGGSILLCLYGTTVGGRKRASTLLKLQDLLDFFPRHRAHRNLFLFNVEVLVDLFQDNLCAVCLVISLGDQSNGLLGGNFFFGNRTEDGIVPATFARRVFSFQFYFDQIFSSQRPTRVGLTCLYQAFNSRDTTAAANLFSGKIDVWIEELLTYARTASGVRLVQRKALVLMVKHRSINLTYRTALKNFGSDPKMETLIALRGSLKELYPLKNIDMF